MTTNLRFVMPMLALTLASTAGAAMLPAGSTQAVDDAARQLQEAALLSNVATDRAQAQRLLAARDLLRSAEPSLDGRLREQARVLDCEIGHDLHAADRLRPPPLFTLAPSPPEATVDRDDLAALARRGAALARRVDEAVAGSAAS